MSNFYYNYLKKHNQSIPKYLYLEKKAHWKHKAYIEATYSKGTEKHSKLLKILRANTRSAYKNSQKLFSIKRHKNNKRYLGL